MFNDENGRVQLRWKKPRIREGLGINIDGASRAREIAITDTKTEPLDPARYTRRTKLGHIPLILVMPMLAFESRLLSDTYFGLNVAIDPRVA